MLLGGYLVIGMTIMGHDLSPWIISGIGAIMAGLTAAVVTLFKLKEIAADKNFEAVNTRLAIVEQRADKCDEDRRDLREQVGRLDERIKLNHPKCKGDET